MPADWQLPPGVSRGLWELLHDPAAARGYDAQIADSPLFTIDRRFVLEHCPAPGRLIDLGCGTGRLALTLAQHGHSVIAVDLSAEMLRILRSRIDAATDSNIHLLQANLVELDCLADQSFDYAACLFNTLGMIEGLEPRRRFLRHVQRLLRPGGVFVLHVHNRWFHLGTRAGRRLLLRHYAAAWFGRQPRGDFLMPPHQGHAPITMHLFTRREIHRELREAGFEIVEIRPISVTKDGRLRAPWWFGRLRAYGYLIAARSKTTTDDTDITDT